MQTNVLIAGLGLIGGSIAGAIRTAHREAHIIGFDPHRPACEEALRRGVIDEAVQRLEDGAGRADLIILAVPVEAIKKMIEKLAGVPLKPDVIVTDVGSTKRGIMKAAEQYLDGRCCFIGGHPMAGSHKSGVSAARADLFENAYYFIVAEENSGKEAAARRLQDWLKGTHAKFVRVTPEAHDAVVGVISHFPHLVAAALVHHLKNQPDSQVNLRALAAGGFRDITRIASSDPVMWQDIVSNNRDVLMTLFDEWSDEMDKIKAMIEADDKAQIRRFFAEAKHYRDGFPQKQKGAIPSYYDLYVDVPDEPDSISTVTGYIGRAGINLTNVEIIEARENIFGVMRLTFQMEEGRDRAIRILQEHGYNTYLND